MTRQGERNEAEGEGAGRQGLALSLQLSCASGTHARPAKAASACDTSLDPLVQLELRKRERRPAGAILWILGGVGEPALSEAVAEVAPGPPGSTLPPSLQEPPLFCRRRQGHDGWTWNSLSTPTTLLPIPGGWPLTSLSLSPRSPQLELKHRLPIA